MARNKEKHAGRLNRLWLQQLDEETLEKNPPRPGLGSLKSATEVKRWLPSIKRDIDFYLKQSQVGCYPERLITDFSNKIESLTKEYRAYVRKLRDLEPQMGAVPWTDRPYNRKHKLKDETHDIGDDKKAKSDDNEAEITESTSDFVPIAAPVLTSDNSYTDVYGYNMDKPSLVQNTDPETENLPLNFNWNKEDSDTSVGCRTEEDRISERVITGIVDVHQDMPLTFNHSKEYVDQGLACNNLNGTSDQNRTDNDSESCKVAVTNKDGERDLNDLKHCSASKSGVDNNCALNSVDKICGLNRVDNSCCTSSVDKICAVNSVDNNNSCALNVLNLPYFDSSSDEEVDNETAPT